jgi:hypothetical protein
MKGMLTIGKSEIIKFAVDFGSNNPQFVRICWTNSLFQFWKERVRSPLMARFTRYNIMWYSLSVTCDRSEVFSSYSGFLHHWNWSPQYSWNIVESGVKYWLIDSCLCLTPITAIFQLYYGDQFLVVEEARVPGDNHRPWASNW